MQLVCGTCWPSSVTTPRISWERFARSFALPRRMLGLRTTARRPVVFAIMRMVEVNRSALAGLVESNAFLDKNIGSTGASGAAHCMVQSKLECAIDSASEIVVAFDRKP